MADAMAEDGASAPTGVGPVEPA
eukprot:COSAG01_NODE_36321_length_519_cov_1.221429_1_plen_22_part_01